MSQGMPERLQIIELEEGSVAYVTRDPAKLLQVLLSFGPDHALELTADAARQLRQSHDKAAIVLVHENDGRQEFHRVPAIFGDIKNPQPAVEWGLVRQPGSWDQITYVSGVVTLSTLIPSFVRDDAKAELLLRNAESTRPNVESHVRPNQLVY